MDPQNLLNPDQDYLSVKHTGLVGPEHGRATWLEQLGAAYGSAKQTQMGQVGIRNLIQSTSPYWSKDTISKKQANETYGLTIKDDGKPIDRNLAGALYLEKKQAELDYQVLEQSDTGIGTILAGGFLAALSDPAEFAINVATGGAIGAGSRLLSGGKAVFQGAKAGRFALNSTKLPMFEQALFRAEEAGNVFKAASRRAVNPLSKLNPIAATAVEAGVETTISSSATVAMAPSIGVDYDEQDAFVDIVASTLAGAGISAGMKGLGKSYSHVADKIHTAAVNRILEPDKVAAAEELSVVTGQPVHLSRLVSPHLKKELEKGYEEISREFAVEVRAERQEVPELEPLDTDTDAPKTVEGQVKKSSEEYEPTYLESEEAIHHSTPLEREVLEVATTPKKALEVVDNNLKDLMDAWTEYAQILTRYPDNHRARRDSRTMPAYHEELTAAADRAQELMDSLGFLPDRPIKTNPKTGVPKLKSIEAAMKQLGGRLEAATEKVAAKIASKDGDLTSIKEAFVTLNKRAADIRSKLNNARTTEAGRKSLETKLGEIVPELIAVQKALQELEPGRNWASQLTLQDNIAVLKGVLPDEFLTMVKALSGEEVDVELPLYQLRNNVVRNIKDRMDRTSNYLDEVLNSPAPDVLPPKERQLLNDVEEFLKQNNTFDPLELHKTMVTSMEGEVKAMRETGLFNERDMASVESRIDKAVERFSNDMRDIAALKKASPVADACSRILLDSEID